MTKFPIRIFALVYGGWLSFAPVIGIAAPPGNGSGVLSYRAALDAILGRDTTVGVQSARVRAARAQNLPNRLVFLPSVTVNHSEYRARARRASLVRDSQSAGLSASWNLFRSGSDIAGWEAADAEIEAAEHTLSQTTLTAELDASRRIFNLIVSNGQVAIARRLYESIRENHRIANARFERGLLPRQEVEKVFIDLTNAEARLRDAEIRAVEANAQLTEALGHANVREEWPWQAAFLKGQVELDKRGLALTNLPLYQAASENYEKERQRAKRDFRKMFVSADLTADYYFRSTNAYSDEWSGTLTFSLPIFDQLINYSRYSTQVESRAIAEYQLEQTRRDVESEYKSARESFRTTLATAISRQDSLAIARRLYRDNELRFKGGRISANDLIVDQGRLYQAEQNALDGWNAAHLAFIRLCHSLGSRIQECEGAL